MARRSTCDVCGGPIVYYPRAEQDTPPNSTSVNDDDRWAHERFSDFLGNPHRAQPTPGVTV